MLCRAQGTGSEIRLRRLDRPKRGKAKETYLASEIAKLGPEFHSADQTVVACTLFSAHSSTCCKLAAAAKASTFANQGDVGSPMSEDDEGVADDDAAHHSASDPGCSSDVASDDDLVANHRSVSEVTL